MSEGESIEQEIAGLTESGRPETPSFLSTGIEGNVHGSKSVLETVISQIVTSEEEVEVVTHRKRFDPTGEFFIPLQDIPKFHFSVEHKGSSMPSYVADMYQTLAVTSKRLIDNRECREALLAYQKHPSQETAQRLANTINEHGNWILWDKAQCRHGNNSESCSICGTK